MRHAQCVMRHKGIPMHDVQQADFVAKKLIPTRQRCFLNPANNAERHRMVPLTLQAKNGQRNPCTVQATLSCPAEKGKAHRWCPSKRFAQLSRQSAKVENIAALLAGYFPIGNFQVVQVSPVEYHCLVLTSSLQEREQEMWCVNKSTQVMKSG